MKEYPTRELSSNDIFYRLRISPKFPYNIDEYDSPPESYLGNYRFDSKDFPIMYTSQDLEVCIHECRVKINDEIYFAKLVPTSNLKLLDLTEILDENNVTEFESLDIAIHMLFCAEEHSYEITRNVAKKVIENNFDGIIYPSYFSFVRSGAIPLETVYGISIRRLKELKEFAKKQIIQNIALFGRPIKENKVNVECINRVILNKIFYELSYGPAFHKAFEE